MGFDSGAKEMGDLREKKEDGRDSEKGIRKIGHRIR
jgi:hypothetical protein